VQAARGNRQPMFADQPLLVAIPQV
jgi:hypothetical protein